jgi:hypothetical protein
MPVPDFADNTRADSLASRLRAHRYRMFLERMRPEQAARILDVGGSAHFWRNASFAGQVTILNLAPPVADDLGCRFVQANALKLPFADDSFDLVFSNSVIEHVGGPTEQRIFADEIQRVGRRYWVQAPNRYFPIEPHFLFPIFQFLPTWLQRLVGRHWPFSWLKHYAATQAQIDREIANLRLPSVPELCQLFPGSQYYPERVMRMTKSVIFYS